MQIYVLKVINDKITQSTFCEPYWQIVLLQMKYPPVGKINKESKKKDIYYL